MQLIGRNISVQSEQSSKKTADLVAKSTEMSDSERELRKRLDIVYRVFKEASKKLNRVDRCWQEVIDSQVYIIEELKNDTGIKERSPI